MPSPDKTKGKSTRVIYLSWMQEDGQLVRLAQPWVEQFYYTLAANEEDKYGVEVLVKDPFGRDINPGDFEGPGEKRGRWESATDIIIVYTDYYYTRHRELNKIQCGQGGVSDFYSFMDVSVDADDSRVFWLAQLQVANLNLKKYKSKTIADLKNWHILCGELNRLPGHPGKDGPAEEFLMAIGNARDEIFAHKGSECRSCKKTS